VVEVIRKSTLPTPDEVIPQLRKAAAEAHAIELRESRPAGFPLFFSSALELIEPAIAYLHEHTIQRAHSVETLRTYAEALYDWLDAPTAPRSTPLSPHLHSCMRYLFLPVHPAKRIGGLELPVRHR
jgi:hypothetical protein